MDGQVITLIISVIANFLLAVLIILHLRKSQSGNFLFWVIIGLTGWIVTNYYSNLNFSLGVLAWINKLIFFFTTIFGAALALFVESFPQGIKISKKINSIIVFIVIFILWISMSSFLVKNVIPRNGIVDLEFGWGMIVYSFFILACLLFSTIRIVIKYLKEKNKDIKNNMQLLIVGIAVFLILAIGTNLILPLLGIFDLSILAPVYTSVFSLIIFIAILKYHFLNVKVITTELFTFALWVFLTIEVFITTGYLELIMAIVMLLLSIVFGYLLIKSVRNEVQRKEELQMMADKLSQANDQLRKLDNAKTEFISIASHQLRTPITSIKGFSSLVLEGSYGELNENLHGAIEKIYGSSERLVTLIEDLLNVSRIESGRMQFAFEKASVSKLLQELYDNFLLIAKTKKFFLDLKLPDQPLPEIVMDYSKIRELVSNFIDNGLKYTENGGVTISAEMRDFGVVIDDKGFVIPNEKSPYGKVVRISVTDTGIGIPKEEIPYLFKKFSRGKDVSRLHVGGTGLGLYVGKAIAEAHHGQVWVESEGDGKGSSFIIEIPVEHVS